MSRTRVREPVLAGAAWAGVVTAHWIAYLIAVPGASARQTLLTETGHGYWLAAVAGALVFGVLSASSTVVRSFARGRRASTQTSVARPYRALVVRLALLQVAIFVVQEVLERLEAGAPMASLIHGGFLVIGIAAQITVAALLALALTCLGRAAEAIGRAFAEPLPIPRPVARMRAPVGSLPIARSSRPAWASRAPPRLLVITG